MKDIQQLIKKNSQEGRYEYIFPKTFTDAVKDKESGKPLIDILSSFNMYFLSYNGSRELTRLQVPLSLRKTGLWITYVLYDKTVVTEWYAGEAIDDDSWKNLSNWRVGSNMLVGDISISSDGYWVVNGVVTTTKAQGEQGITPMLRVGSNNHLQVSYTNGSSWVDVSTNPVYTQFRVLNNKLQQSTDLGNTYTYISEELAYKFQESGNKLQMSKDLGNTWEDVSDYIAAWFKFTGTTGSSQADNVGKIQISRDNGTTWADLSGEFTNSLYIKGYVATVATLPSSAVQGDIYGVGPTYDPSDTGQTNPIYQLYVKDSTGWVNNGKFTSIAAGVVQTTGTSTTEVMSQDAVSKEFASVRSDLSGIEKSIVNAASPFFTIKEKTTQYDRLNGYALVGNGLYEQNSDCKLFKLSVTEGSYLYLDLPKLAGGVFQFQSTANMSSYGNVINLIGDVCTESYSGVVKVPDGALYLICVGKSTDISIEVYNLNETSKIGLLDGNERNINIVPSIYKEYPFGLSSSYSFYEENATHIFINVENSEKITFDLTEQNSAFYGMFVADMFEAKLNYVPTSVQDFAVSKNTIRTLNVPSGAKYAVVPGHKGGSDYISTVKIYLDGYEITKDIKSHFNDVQKDISELSDKAALIAPIAEEVEELKGVAVYPQNVPMELGNINYNVETGFTYVDGNFIRTPENVRISLRKGTVIRLKDYSNARIYPASQNADGYSFYGWWSEPMTVPKDGSFVFRIRKTDGSIITSVSDLASLLEIVINDNTQEYHNDYLQSRRRPRVSATPVGIIPLTLVQFTDIHNDSLALTRILEHCRKYSPYIDDILQTGDAVQRAYNETDAFEFWTECGAENVLNVIGNHDVALLDGDDYSPNIATPQQTYNMFIKDFVSGWNVTQPVNAEANGYCYYYKDYQSARVRLIVLDCMRYDTTQDDWFRGVLSDAAQNGLAVVAASHYFAGNFTGYDSPWMSLQNKASTFISPLATASVDYYMNNAEYPLEFVCWLTGHTHFDNIGKLDDYPSQICIAVDTASMENSAYSDIQRELCTKSEDLFNVFSIDTYNKNFKIFRVGADRDLWLRHRGHITVNYSTGNIVYQD